MYPPSLSCSLRPTALVFLHGRMIFMLWKSFVFRISKTCYSFSEAFLAIATLLDVNMLIPVNVSMTALCYRSKKDHGRLWPGSHRTSQKWTHDLGRIYRSSKIAKTQHPQRCSWTFSTARKMPRFFVWYSLMELYLSTNNRELESILNYFSYWRENKQC